MLLMHFDWHFILFLTKVDICTFVMMHFVFPDSLLHKVLQSLFPLKIDVDIFQIVVTLRWMQEFRCYAECKFCALCLCCEIKLEQPW